MRLAAFQFDVCADDPARNLARVEEGLRAAAERAVELVVLPEMWPTSFPTVAGLAARDVEATAEALLRLRALTAELGLVAVGSAYAPRAEPARPFNRLHVFERGRQLATYDKVHLFTPTAEPESFSAGEEPPGTVETAVGRLSGVVCYDLRFPEIARVPFRAGVDVLAVPAQWPVARAAHWRALAIARAIEAQCVVVAANRTGTAFIGRRRMQLEFPGNSLVVSPLGEVLAEGRGEEGLISAEVDLTAAQSYRTRVPVAKDDRPDLYARWLARSSAELTE